MGLLCSTRRNHPCGEPGVQKVRKRELIPRLGARKSSIRAVGEEPWERGFRDIGQCGGLAGMLIIITTNNIF